MGEFHIDERPSGHRLREVTTGYLDFGKLGQVGSPCALHTGASRLR